MPILEEVAVTFAVVDDDGDEALLSAQKQGLTERYICWLCGVVAPGRLYLRFFRALLEGQEEQSILISGVSGAGKTETAKLLLGHLASVAGSEEGGVGSERIQHMVECTVVLESFGNAVMVRASCDWPHAFGGQHEVPVLDLCC